MFYHEVVALFGQDDYFRAPNAEDTTQIEAHNRDGLFPWMVGSIDYMHLG
jgi:hypothetical protein